MPESSGTARRAGHAEDVATQAPPRRALVGRSAASLRAKTWANRKRLLALTGLVLLMAAASAVLATWRDFFDLNVYFGAINYWAQGDRSIYDFVLPNSTYGFTYTPFAALVMLPLALVSWPVAIVATCAAIAVVTVMVVSWFIDPVARRQGWVPWYAVGIVAACMIAFDPLRETLLFGQVNMYLVALVGVDLLFLVRRGSRFAGVGIGLATALKLTPGVFLIYLLVTKRWRAALTASSAAAGATLLGAALAPDASRVFWTDALWNTDRVGQAAYISNQSLKGAVARLSEQEPSTLLWALAVIAVLVVWAVRVRRAVAVGDEKTGFALTGVVTCLISPITWIHHLVWLMPALLLLFDRSVTAESLKRQRWLWGFTLGAYAVLSSRIVWAFDENWTANPMVWFVSNAYVWISLALLVALPIATASAPTATQPGPAQPPGAAPRGEPNPGVPAVDLDEAMATLLRDERTASHRRS